MNVKRHRRTTQSPTSAAGPLSTDDLAGVIEALTGERVIPRSTSESVEPARRVRG